MSSPRTKASTLKKVWAMVGLLAALGLLGGGVRSADDVKALFCGNTGEEAQASP